MSSSQHENGSGSGEFGSLRSTSTPRSLIDRLREDDRQAWERLLRIYAPLVYHWCRKWNLQHADAADVFQEVFRAVAIHIAEFRTRKEGDTFRGWLRTITRSKVSDLFRRMGREPIGVGGTEAQMRWNQVARSDGSTGEEPSAVAGEMTARVVEGAEDSAHSDPAERKVYQRAMDMIRGDFEPRTWQAFVKTTLEGRSPADVAADLSMTPGAVRVAKSRVLHRLRELLGDVQE